jgi:hypothetical protein
MSTVDFSACYDCLSAGQTDPEYIFCAKFDCQVFDECMETSCFPCRDEIQASLECEMKRDCGIICNCNEEADKANACVASYAWTGDIDECLTCSAFGPSDPEDLSCIGSDCDVLSDCVATNCGGCEEDLNEYFKCQLRRDCWINCDDVCYDVVKDANDCANSNAWYDLKPCTECPQEVTCVDLKCDEVYECVQTNCGGCVYESLAVNACKAERDCGASCPSGYHRRLEAPKLSPKKLYRGAGLANNIGAFKNKPHKFGHRLR